MSCRYRLLALLLIARCQLAEHESAEALDRARGNDSFRGAADAEQQVASTALPRGQDRTGNVAVGDQLDPRPRGAHLGDEYSVPLPVQHDHRDVVRRNVLGPGHGSDVGGGWCVDVHEIRGLSAWYEP